MLQMRGRDRDESVLEKVESEATYRAALQKTCERYDRYASRREEWIDFTGRRNRLSGIALAARDMAKSLSQLDVISLDDLAVRVGAETVDNLVGLLGRVGNNASGLAKEAQKLGKRRDLARERWIMEMADIFESSFGARASSWAFDTRSRSRFILFLDESNASHLRGRVELHPKLIAKILKGRHKSPP